MEVRLMFNELCAWISVRIDTMRDESGQTAVEYALVIGLVAIVLAIALAAGGLNVFGDLWARVRDALGGPTV